MDQRITKLIAEFEQAGWKSHGSVEITSDWWFEDIILLVSEWRPTGTLLYLTLLTYPEVMHQKVVWAVSFSSSLPEQNNLKTFEFLSLNDIKKINLTEFVKGVSSVALNK